MTALQQAFEKAGYQPPLTVQQRLSNMMRDAIRRGNGKADASRDYFIAALVRENDAALLWELFAPVRAAIIGRLFTETLVEIRAEDALRDAGEANGGTPKGHDGIAEPATKTEGEATTGVSQGHQLLASSSASHTAAEAKSMMPGGQNAVASAAVPQKPSRVRYGIVETVARLSILRTFKINGQALADVTGAEARAWLKSHQRDGRFVALVSYQVPDEIKIGTLVPEDEADKLFKLATEAGNA